MKFQRVADAVRRVELAGASVKWNSRIAGERFDVVLRSPYEDQEFLIVVDCVDAGSPVTPGTVKTFAKKAELAGAHMGIMVSSSEYREDAFKLSGEHSVALMDWETMNETSEDKLADWFKTCTASL